MEPGIISTYFSSISTDTKARALPKLHSEISCCLPSPSLTLVPPIYVKCQVLLSLFLKPVTPFTFLFQANSRHYLLSMWAQIQSSPSASKFFSNLPKQSLKLPKALHSFYDKIQRLQCLLQSDPEYLFIKPENIKTGTPKIMQKRKMKTKMVKFLTLAKITQKEKSQKEKSENI